MRPLRGLTVRLGIRPARQYSPHVVQVVTANGPRPLDGMNAPVYDYAPLDFAVRHWLPARGPYDPDPLVFGPPGSGELQRQWLACGQRGKRRGQCLPALTGARGQAPARSLRTSRATYS